MREKGFLRCFLKILEGGQLEFWNFTGGSFSQKKKILTPLKIRRPPWPPGGAFLGFLIFFLTMLEGGQLEFWNFTGGLFSQKKEILTPKQI